jgi:hypothetical protein
MYLAMAYGLGIVTVLMMLALLWLGWENRRDEIEAAKVQRAKRSAPKSSS